MKPGRKRSLLISLCLALITAEAAARVDVYWILSPEKSRPFLLIEPEKWLYTPHHYMSYSLSRSFRRSGNQFHNSLGYRSEEFPLSKGAGEYRIVFMGGSTTYSTEVRDNDEIFTAHLERLLKRDFPSAENRVINAGIGGHSSHESLINLEFRILDIAPDVIFLYHGPNDVHARYLPPEKYSRDNSGRRSAWRSGYVKWYHHSMFVRILLIKSGLWTPPDLNALVSASGYLHPDYYPPDRINPATGVPFGEWLKQNPPIYFRDNLASFIAIAKDRSIELVLLTFAGCPGFGKYIDSPYFRTAIAEQNQIIRELAVEKGVLLLDFEREFPCERKFFVDGVHENEIGSVKKAQVIHDFILEHGLHAESADNPHLAAKAPDAD